MRYFANKELSVPEWACQSIPELTARCLRAREGWDAGAEGIEKFWRFDVGDDDRSAYVALGELAQVLAGEFTACAEAGAVNASVGVLVVEEASISEPIEPVDEGELALELKIKPAVHYDDEALHCRSWDPPNAHFRVWARSDTFAKMKMFYNFGEVDCTAHLIGWLSDMLVFPYLVSTSGTDYFLVRWADQGWVEDGDGCAEKAAAVESGVSLEDVFAGERQLSRAAV